MTTTPATHWLLFPEAPAPAQVEALVVSRELGVTWVDERTLGWQPGVVLAGPLSAEELEGSGELPPWVGAVYAAAVPRERGAAIPPELLIPGSALAAFPGGEPIGQERAALETLEALARRLGGALLTETGQVVVPEVRPDLVLLSATWIPEGELLELVGEFAPFRDDGGPVVPPGVEVEGYGLVAETDDGVFSVTASPAAFLPLAIQGYPWSKGQVHVYEVRHYPPRTFGFIPPLPADPREADEMVPAGAANTVEQIAARLLAATGGEAAGHLVDDDGFLVDLRRSSQNCPTGRRRGS